MSATSSWRVVSVEGATPAADARGIRPIDHPEWVRLLLGGFLAPVRTSSASGRLRVEYLVSGEELGAGTGPAAREEVRRAVAQDFAEIEAALEDHRARIERVKDGDQSMDWTLFLDSYELLMATTVSGDPADWIVTDEGLCAVRWGLDPSDGGHRPLLLWRREDLGRLRADVERRLGALPPPAIVDLRSKRVLEGLAAAGHRSRDGAKAPAPRESSGRGSGRGAAPGRTVTGGAGPMRAAAAEGRGPGAGDRWLRIGLAVAVALSVMVNVILIAKWRGTARELGNQQSDLGGRIKDLERQLGQKDGALATVKQQSDGLRAERDDMQARIKAAEEVAAKRVDEARREAGAALDQFAENVAWELAPPGSSSQEGHARLEDSLRRAFPEATPEVVRAIVERREDRSLAKALGDGFRSGQFEERAGMGGDVRRALGTLAELRELAGSGDTPGATGSDREFAEWASALPEERLRLLCEVPARLKEGAVQQQLRLRKDSPWFSCVAPAAPDDSGRPRYRVTDCRASADPASGSDAGWLVMGGLPSCAAGPMAFPRLQLHECVARMLSDLQTQLEADDPHGLNDAIATILVADFLDAARLAGPEFSMPTPKEFQSSDGDRKRKLEEFRRQEALVRPAEGDSPGRFAKFEKLRDSVQERIASPEVRGAVAQCRAQVDRLAQVRPFGILRDGRFAAVPADGELPPDWALWELRVVAPGREWYRWLSPAGGDTVGKWAIGRLVRPGPRTASGGAFEILVAIPPAGRAAPSGAVR